jgi:hypothetical protein
VGIEVAWPEKAKAGSSGMLVVTLRHGFTAGDVPVDVQIPLPPGITLAAATSGASQVQGVLALREQVGPGGMTAEIPVRFGLAGSVTVPEATARVARSASGVATAPARVLTVR